MFHPIANDKKEAALGKLSRGLHFCRCMPSRNVHTVHFDNLAVFNTDRGVIGREIIISDFSDQEAAGVIQNFSPVQVRGVIVHEIYRHPDGSLADFIPVLRVTVAALVKNAGLIGDQIKAIFVQTPIDQIAYNVHLEAGDEEINAMVETIAMQNGLTVEQLQSQIDADFSVAVVRSVLTNKVMKLIRDTAEIEEIVSEK